MQVVSKFFKNMWCTWAKGKKNPSHTVATHGLFCLFDFISPPRRENSYSDYKTNWTLEKNVLLPL